MTLITADDLLSADVLGERCVLWPQTAEYHATRYGWTPPPGVVAIVHTHPVSTPRPSSGDKASAIRLGIPICAITLANIYKADRFGNATAIVRDHRWFHERSLTRGLCEFVPRAALMAEEATARRRSRGPLRILTTTAPVQQVPAAAVAPE